MTTLKKKLGTAALAAVLFTISAAGTAAFATSVRDDRVVRGHPRLPEGQGP
jgi:hypothetical protein